MTQIKFKVNGKSYSLMIDPDTPLLWVLRDHLKLTGTKYSCGMGICGCCTVHVDKQPTRSCITPVSAVAGKAIVTIEGLDANGLHPLQRAWIDGDVPQCGYCQPGQIMTAAALLEENPQPTDADIDDAMSGTLCRCGTYQRIRNAIHQAAKEV